MLKQGMAWGRAATLLIARAVRRIAADVARTFVPSLQRFPRDGTSLPYNAAAVAASFLR